MHQAVLSERIVFNEMVILLAARPDKVLTSRGGIYTEINVAPCAAKRDGAVSIRHTEIEMFERIANQTPGKRIGRARISAPRDDLSDGPLQELIAGNVIVLNSSLIVAPVVLP